MAYSSKNNIPKFGLCIDWETSGADFGKDSSKRYQGITFGAIIFLTKDFSPVEELYCEIKFNSGKVKNDFIWTDGAEKIHGKSREYLEKNGISMEDAALKLLELIVKYIGDQKVLFLGHNCEFDRRFTNQLLREIGAVFSVEQPDPMPEGADTWVELHHVVLDTSALGLITLGIYKSDLLFEKIGFDKRGAHNALEDARMTLTTAAAIKQLVQSALA